MKVKSPRRVKRSYAKKILRLPPGYRHAIEEFFDWYCSERLSFSKIVVVRYRMHLESRQPSQGIAGLFGAFFSRRSREDTSTIRQRHFLCIRQIGLVSG